MTPAPLPPDIARQLGLARMLWLQAQADLAIPSDFAAGEAVKRIHDAFEEFMAAIYRHHKGADVWVDFGVYPEKIRQAAGQRMRHDQVVLELNRERVRTKHQGNLPLYRDARALGERCGVFLAENCELYFKLSFNEVRLSSFVEHEEVRTFLVQAEDAIHANDFAGAMVPLQVAFQVFVSDAVSERLPRGATSLFSINQSLPNRFEIDRTLKDHGMRQLMLRVVEGVEATQRLLEMQAIGINPLERAVFDAISPIVHITEAHKVAGQYRKGPESLLASRENVHWAMNFVLGAILRFQTIPAPFDIWGKHTVRTVSDCAVFDGDGAELKRLSQDSDIESVSFCDHWKVGDTWMWEQDGQRLFMRLEDAVVLETKRHAQLGRERRREMMARGAEPPKGTAD
jgi:hypothetical protein